MIDLFSQRPVQVFTKLAPFSTRSYEGGGGAGSSCHTTPYYYGGASSSRHNTPYYYPQSPAPGMHYYGYGGGGGGGTSSRQGGYGGPPTPRAPPCYAPIALTPGHNPMTPGGGWAEDDEDENQDNQVYKILEVTPGFFGRFPAPKDPKGSNFLSVHLEF